MHQRRGNRVFGQHQLGQLVAVHRELVEHLPAPQLGFVAQLGGNLRDDDLRALAFGHEGEHPHGHQIDQAAEGVVQVRRADCRPAS